MSSSQPQSSMQYQQQQQQQQHQNNRKQVKHAIPVQTLVKQIDKGKVKPQQNSQGPHTRLFTDCSSQGSLSHRQLQFQLQKKNSVNCLFCNKCMKSHQFSKMISTALYSKYSASQNYYFTKDINDILASQRTYAVIRLKDIQTYDEQEEFLNRLYFINEYDNKIKRLTEYYKFHRDIARLFMLPTTNTLNKFHDKKRRIYYIQITRMLKEKEEKQGKKENQETGQKGEGAQNEIQKIKSNEEVDENIKKDEKDFNIDERNNGPDQLKQFDMNERFLAPLDDLDEQTKSVQSNTLQDLNHKLNDILMNSTKSMQSYFFDQDVSQSIGNLSNFLNHLKMQNSLTIPSLPSERQNQQKQNEMGINMINLENAHANQVISFNTQQFQNVLQKQSQKDQQPQLLHNYLQPQQILTEKQEQQTEYNLIKNSQNIKAFLKKDSFLKKPQQELTLPNNEEQLAQNPLPIKYSNIIQPENTIAQQVLQNNNSPPSSQNINLDQIKSSIGCKTDRGQYNQRNDSKDLHQIQNVNQDMIMISLNQHKIQQSQARQTHSAYNSTDNKETQEVKDQQKGLGVVVSYSHQPSQYPSSIQSMNPSQHQSKNERQGSHLKSQSINSGGINNFYGEGQLSVAGSSANNTVNVGIQNLKGSQKNSANQSIKEAKMLEYPFKNTISEFTTGKQSQNQSIERGSLNSLQQSINGLSKQVNGGAMVVAGSSSSSSVEQATNVTHSKLMSNTSSKYSTSQHKSNSKSTQNIQISQNNNNNNPRNSSQQSSDLVINKKINNLVQSDQINQKKTMINHNGQNIPQIPLPTNASVQIIVQNQQQQQQYSQQQQQLQYQQQQQSLSQKLSHQFQQQLSQQMQNYQKSQVQELQNYSATQRQFSQQSKNDYKNDLVDVQKAPNTDRSQYKKNNSTNQQTLSQKTLSARDKDYNQKNVIKGMIDLNGQKQKTYEAMHSRRENQVDIQAQLQHNNLEGNYCLASNSQEITQNSNAAKTFKNSTQSTKQNDQQSQNYINIQEQTMFKSSLDNVKNYSNLLTQGQFQNIQQEQGRPSYLESQRESNLISSQDNTQNYSQSQQISRNQSKNKQMQQAYPLPPTSQFGHQSSNQASNIHTSQQSRQTSQQKGSQMTNQNEPEQLQSSTPFQIRMNQNTEQNQTSAKQSTELMNQNEQIQSQQSQVLLKKSLTNYKFENLGELKQIYKEVQKRTAAMFQKQKESLKNVQTTTVTNQSIQELQYQKQNNLKQKQNYYTKTDNSNAHKGSMTQRGLQISQDQQSSKEISPRIHRIQKSDSQNQQNNSLLKQNSERDSNSRRVSSQLKSSSNFNNSNSYIQPIVGGQKISQQLQQSLANTAHNASTSQLQIATQIQSNSREQAFTTTQKKLQYKQQASKNGSEINSRIIHSNPNVEFNKTSYLTSYNNSVNNTNIQGVGQLYVPSTNPINTGLVQSAYSTIMNNFGSQPNSQIPAPTNTQQQSVTNSQQNSSKKILDKIKHTRINSMNAAAASTSLQSSYNSLAFSNQANFKSSLVASQQSSEYTKLQNGIALQQQHGLNTNHTQFLVSTQNSSNKKKIHHKYNKSEADSLTQISQPQISSQNLPSQSNLGQNPMINGSSAGNKQQLLKQLSQLQGSQSQQHLQALHSNQLAINSQPSSQQLQTQPSYQHLTQQQTTNNTGPESKKIVSSIQQTQQSSSQNQDSPPQRSSQNQGGKKNGQQYFTYSNNNIINIFVNSNQNNSNLDNPKANQVNNNIYPHTQNQPNINSMLNTQININKNIPSSSLSSSQQQQHHHKSQSSPPKKSTLNNGKTSQRSQPDTYSHLKF